VIRKAILLLICVTGLGLAAGDAAAGKAVYDKACRSCHGADGAPNANIAKMMKVEMKHLGAPEVQKRSDDDLKKVTVEGEGKMKPVKTVAGKDLDNVVAYLRTLKK
jgi:mono/diheme cytochrome c family protein